MSAPPGADLYAEGIFIGKTPCVYQKRTFFSKRKDKFTLQKENYYPVELYGKRGGSYTVRLTRALHCSKSLGKGNPKVQEALQKNKARQTATQTEEKEIQE